MWMCYVQEVEIKDLESGVRHLWQQFNNLQFDAEHEAVYGLGRFYSEEECAQLAEKYGRAADICDQFLEGGTCETCLVDELMLLGFSGFLYRIADYLDPELRSKFYVESDHEETDGEADSGIETNTEDSTHPE